MFGRDITVEDILKKVAHLFILTMNGGHATGGYPIQLREPRNELAGPSLHVSSEVGAGRTILK
jgi:hypothetical protein